MTCCDETKETRFCKDCVYWETNENLGSGFAICTEYQLNGSYLVSGDARHEKLTTLITWRNFGCVRCLEKPKGPFIVCEGTRDSWTIRYLPHNSHVITAWSRGEASRACRELNTLWESKE